MGWLPISEAPTDGTPLLLFARCVDATAICIMIGWHLRDPRPRWIEAAFCGQEPVEIIPSHFRRLPPFPERMEP